MVRESQYWRDFFLSTSYFRAHSKTLNSSIKILHSKKILKALDISQDGQIWIEPKEPSPNNVVGRFWKLIWLLYVTFSCSQVCFAYSFLSRQDSSAKYILSQYSVFLCCLILFNPTSLLRNKCLDIVLLHQFSLLITRFQSETRISFINRTTSLKAPSKSFRINLQIPIVGSWYTVP